MSLARKEQIRELTKRIVPRIGQHEPAQTEDQVEAKVTLQQMAKDALARLNQ